MDIINNNTVKVSTSEELKDVLENENEYEYVYLGNSISLTSGIVINEKKGRVVIDGTSNGVKYTLIGLNSSDVNDTIVANVLNKEIQFRNINIEYTNPYGVIYVKEDSNYASVLSVFDNVVFTGPQLLFAPYSSVKITDSIITIKESNGVEAQRVCYANNIIIGGKVSITSNSLDYPLFFFRSDTLNPSIIFLCKSNIRLTSDNKEFMNGTMRLNLTILHDTNVDLFTGNGFAAYTIHGANNVLIDERATLNFFENNHQRVPMWSIFGNLTMKEDSNLQVINSYDNTPVDNYNIYFKGTNQSLVLDNPKSVVFYTPKANIIYTDNALNYKIKCRRINMWTEATALTSAGDINDLPEYSWYKDEGLLEMEGIVTSTETTITSHNFTTLELEKLPDLSKFSFQAKKEFSIGNNNINVHQLSASKNTISGHTLSDADVLIKYNGEARVVHTDDDGYFEYVLTETLKNDTEVEFIANVSSSFIYGSRVVKSPYDGELSFLDNTSMFVFTMSPISINPVILPKDRDFLIKVIDSRLNSSDFKIYAYILKPVSSQMGYTLVDALVFKTFENELVVLNETPKLVYTGSSSQGEYYAEKINWSKEKGPLLDLSNNALVPNEEYFCKIYFKLEE